MFFQAPYTIFLFFSFIPISLSIGVCHPLKTKSSCDSRPCSHPPASFLYYQTSQWNCWHSKILSGHLTKSSCSKPLNPINIFSCGLIGVFIAAFNTTIPLEILLPLAFQNATHSWLSSHPELFHPCLPCKLIFICRAIKYWHSSRLASSRLSFLRCLTTLFQMSVALTNGINTQKRRETKNIFDTSLCLISH